MEEVLKATANTVLPIECSPPRLTRLSRMPSDLESQEETVIAVVVAVARPATNIKRNLYQNDVPRLMIRSLALDYCNYRLFDR